LTAFWGEQQAVVAFVAAACIFSRESDFVGSADRNHDIRSQAGCSENLHPLILPACLVQKILPTAVEGSFQALDHPHGGISPTCLDILDTPPKYRACIVARF
jgi:hypothetical protein